MTHACYSFLSGYFRVVIGLSALVSSGAEAAMEWVLAHMEDPDFNTPEASSAGKQAPTSCMNANGRHKDPVL